MGVALVQPLHGVMGNDAHADGGGEEQHGVHQHLTQPCAGAGAGSQHTGQHHDADDIIDDSGTDNGGAKKALQVAHLLQGGHGDGHAGGGHNGTDEESTVELLAAQRREAVEQTIKERAPCQRHRHAHTGDQGGDGACLDQLLQIGAKARGEHQQHHADLCKDRDGIADMHKVQQAGPNDQARNDLAHHLRCLALAGHQPEELGTEDDDGKVPKNRIHKFVFLRSISLYRAAGRARHPISLLYRRSLPKSK